MAVSPDFAAVDVAVGRDDRAGRDDGILDYAVSAHSHIVAQTHVALEEAAYIDFDIPPAIELASHLDP